MFMLCAFKTEIFLVLEKYINEYGGAVRFWFGPELYIVITNPKDIEVRTSANSIAQVYIYNITNYRQFCAAPRCWTKVGNIEC